MDTRRNLSLAWMYCIAYCSNPGVGFQSIDSPSHENGESLLTTSGLAGTITDLVPCMIQQGLSPVASARLVGLSIKESSSDSYSCNAPPSSAHNYVHVFKNYNNLGLKLNKVIKSKDHSINIF
ncbi:hypothetical protein TNCV_2728351 [Trichonephila clavipes]|nr:hypothetical protein TNCV_2728351 [Trichonephila clavipes]